jgi:hypothetical protein
MKAKKSKSADFHTTIVNALNAYAHIPEMKTDGSTFEKRKIKLSAFSSDKTQLTITGGGSDAIPYFILPGNIRKVYLRKDRDYDKIILVGTVLIGEGVNSWDQYKLNIYLKGYPSNSEIPHQLKNAFNALRNGTGK